MKATRTPDDGYVLTLTQHEAGLMYRSLTEYHTILDRSSLVGRQNHMADIERMKRALDIASTNPTRHDSNADAVDALTDPISGLQG